MESGLYKSALLDHFRNPRNRGDLDQMTAVGRGRNPRCGDDIEVGVLCQNKRLVEVHFRGRGCSVCLASASMMTECVSGLSFHEAKTMVQELNNWLDGKRDTSPSVSLEALDCVRRYSARRTCLCLPWYALENAMEAHKKTEG